MKYDGLQDVTEKKTDIMKMELALSAFLICREGRKFVFIYLFFSLLCLTDIFHTIADKKSACLGKVNVFNKSLWNHGLDVTVP